MSRLLLAQIAAFVVGAVMAAALILRPVFRLLREATS
jgi:hypothetical protein